MGDNMDKLEDIMLREKNQLCKYNCELDSIVRCTPMIPTFWGFTPLCNPLSLNVGWT